MRSSNCGFFGKAAGLLRNWHLLKCFTLMYLPELVYISYGFAFVAMGWYWWIAGKTNTFCHGNAGKKIICLQASNIIQFNCTWPREESFLFFWVFFLFVYVFFIFQYLLSFLHHKSTFYRAFRCSYGEKHIILHPLADSTSRHQAREYLTLRAGALLVPCWTTCFWVNAILIMEVAKL